MPGEPGGTVGALFQGFDAALHQTHLSGNPSQLLHRRARAACVCRAWCVALAQAPVHSITLAASPDYTAKVAWVAHTRPAVVRLRIIFNFFFAPGATEALAAAAAALSREVGGLVGGCHPVGGWLPAIVCSAATECSAHREGS